MSGKHKHYDTIIAYANGAKIQRFHAVEGKWIDTDNPGWYAKDKYRVKPEPDQYRVAIFKMRDDSYAGCIYFRPRLNAGERSAVENGTEVMQGFHSWAGDWQDLPS